MGFFCFGNENYNNNLCAIFYSIYWALIYIIVVVLSGSLYLTGYTSRAYYVNDPYTYTTSNSTISTTDISGTTTTTTIPTNQTGIKKERLSSSTIKYLIKLFGIFNIILIFVIILIVLKIYLLMISN